MSDSIPIAFAQHFRGDYMLLSQQKGSRLKRTVRQDPDELHGKAGYFERIGAVSMVEKTTRHTDTPNVEVPHSRRAIYLRDFIGTDMIDRVDAMRLMNGDAMPEKYRRTFVYANGRQLDDIIIAAGNGNATSVDEDDTTSSVALPAAQKVVVGTTGLTLPKVLNAKEILDGADIDPDEERFAIVKAAQMTDMLNVTEVKSSDYNSVKALVEGTIDRFLGFTWIRSERLTADASSDVLCQFYSETAMGLASGGDPYVRITERDDKNYDLQIYLSESYDATRIEDEKFVQVACNP